MLNSERLLKVEVIVFEVNIFNKFSSYSGPVFIVFTHEYITNINIFRIQHSAKILNKVRGSEATNNVWEQFYILFCPNLFNMTNYKY